MIGLHGYGRSFSDLVGAGIGLDVFFADKAVLALPNALPDPNGKTTWGIDMTVAFFDELVERIADETEFDRDKIFVVGASNGAFMANTLACRRGDAIRGVAMQAGGVWSDGACVGEPAVWISHDVGDQYVPIAQGQGLVGRWTEANDCGVETSGPDDDGCVTYEQCVQPVKYCEHSDSGLEGHLWPSFATANLGNFFASLEPRKNSRPSVSWPRVDTALAEQGEGDGRVSIRVMTTKRSDISSPTTAPAVGAEVAVETSNGALIEGKTDASGELVVEGVSFSDGPVNVTAFLDGHRMYSRTGVSADASGDALVELELHDLETPWGEQVSLSGKLSGRPATSAWMRIAGNPGTEGWAGDATSYEVQVPRGEDITLVLSHWSTPEHSQKYPDRQYNAQRSFNVFNLGVVDQATAIDLDLSVPAAATEARGVFSLPNEPGLLGLQTAKANVVVQPLSGYWASLGGAVHTEIYVDTGEVYWETRVVESYASSQVFTSYGVQAQERWTFPHHPLSAESGGLLSGYPGESPVPPLLAPAVVTQPIRGQAWPLHAPITWKAGSEGAPHQIDLTNAEQNIEWTVELQPEVREMTIPRPPRSVTEAFGEKPVAAWLLYCEKDTQVHPMHCTRFARTESLFLLP